MQVWGSSPKSRQFWTERVKIAVQRKFIGALDEKEARAEYDLRGPLDVLHFQLFRALQLALAVRFGPAVDQRLLRASGFAAAPAFEAAEMDDSPFRVAFVRTPDYERLLPEAERDLFLRRIALPPPPPPLPPAPSRSSFSSAAALATTEVALRTAEAEYRREEEEDGWVFIERGRTSAVSTGVGKSERSAPADSAPAPNPPTQESNCRIS